MSSQAATAPASSPPLEATFSQSPGLSFAGYADLVPLTQGYGLATQTDRPENDFGTLLAGLSNRPSPQRQLRPDPHRFLAKQKWEGYVTEVGPETFWARLILLSGEGGDQDAEIYLEEVDREERSLIEPGAVFYWSIGYLDGPSGRARTSQIRFRRLPAWHQRELEEAITRSAELHDLFDARSTA